MSSFGDDHYPNTWFISIFLKHFLQIKDEKNIFDLGFLKQFYLTFNLLLSSRHQTNFKAVW